METLPEDAVQDDHSVAGTSFQHVMPAIILRQSKFEQNPFFQGRLASLSKSFGKVDAEIIFSVKLRYSLI